MWAWVLEQLRHNQVFAGLAGASIVGPIFYYLRNAPGTIKNFIVDQSVVTLTVGNEDSAFESINEWLASLSYAKRTRRIRLNTWHDREGDSWTMAPGSGWHLFRFQGFPVLVTRKTDESANSGSQGFRQHETFRIITLGRRQHRIRTVIDAARNINLTDTIKLYMWSSSYWEMCGYKMRRPLHTLILPAGQIERIIDDIRWFVDAAEWYKQRGVPYRRGYLFSGSPGTGKSSLVSVLAAHFNLPIYVINLSSINGDDRLFYAFAQVPRRALLLIEDVDAVSIPLSHGSRSKSKPSVVGERVEAQDETRIGGLGFSGENSKVTLSGFLNTIDGVGSSEGRVLIMTTNFPDKLDPALVRPGRVDVHERLGLFGADEVRRMFSQFYPDDPVPYNRIAVNGGVSPARVQQHLMQHRNARDALHALSALTKD